MKKKTLINPDIQPGSTKVYRGGINIPLPIIRNSIKSFGDLRNNQMLNTIINFMIVIGIAVMTIVWAILETSK